MRKTSPLVFEMELKFAHPVALPRAPHRMQIGDNFCWIPDEVIDENPDDFLMIWDMFHPIDPEKNRS